MEALPQRWTTRDRLLETHFFYGDPGRRVGFAETQDLCIYGKKPIRPFHTPDTEFMRDLNATYPPPLSTLGPMSPLIDLESTHYYLDESSDGWVKNAVSYICYIERIIVVLHQLMNHILNGTYFSTLLI